MDSLRRTQPISCGSAMRRNTAPKSPVIRKAVSLVAKASAITADARYRYRFFPS